MSRHPDRGRLARGLLGLYPPAWRDRYGEEYLALLDDTDIHARQVLDSGRAAAAAWLRPPGQLHTPAQRMRSTVSVVLCAWTALAAGALLFGQATEDAPVHAMDHQHSAARTMYATYVLTAHLSVLVLVAGALPLAWTVYRSARLARRRGTQLLLLAPVIAVAGFAVVLVAIVKLIGRSHTPGVGIGLWFLPLAAAGLAAGACCAIGPALAVRRAEPAGLALRVAVAAGTVAAGGMVASVLASVGYGIALHRFEPELIAGSPAALAGYAAVMSVAGAVAATSCRRGMPAALSR